MKDIEALLAQFNVTIPNDVSDAFLKEFHANYKTVAEVNKLNDRLAAANQKATDAEEALKAFDGVDPAAMQKTVDEWKAKAEAAEKEYTAKLAEMERDEAIESGLKDYKFSSKAARERIFEKIRKSDLPVRDKSMLGLDDLMRQYQESDADAFVTEAETNKAKFTSATHGNGSSLTAEDIMAIPDTNKRLEAIANNLELFD